MKVLPLQILQTNLGEVVPIKTNFSLELKEVHGNNSYGEVIELLQTQYILGIYKVQFLV